MFCAVGGAMLSLNSDGRYEEAIIRLDNGTVVRANGPWYFQQGKLTLVDWFPPPQHFDTGAAAHFGPDPNSESAEWTTYYSSGMIMSVSRGVPVIRLNADTYFGIPKVPPSLPTLLERGRSENELVVSGEQFHIVEGNYLAAIEKGIEVLRLTKNSECFLDRLSYPTLTELHWKGSWSIHELQNEVVLDNFSVVSGDAAAAGRSALSSMRFRCSYDKRGSFLRQEGANAVYFKPAKDCDSLSPIFEVLPK
ncbi:MAG: hypothetical protein HZB26_04160 [Candidatus Hydrogenedentes bacterium]|nr:hypothetical protein [Candidatus Hydrogenedentota bacterium]